MEVVCLSGLLCMQYLTVYQSGGLYCSTHSCIRIRKFLFLHPLFLPPPSSLLRPSPFRLLHMLQRETLCLLSCNSRVAEFGTEMKTWLLQAISEEGEKDEETSEVGTALLAR